MKPNKPSNKSSETRGIKEKKKRGRNKGGLRVVCGGFLVVSEGKIMKTLDCAS